MPFYQKKGLSLHNSIIAGDCHGISRPNPAGFGEIRGQKRGEKRGIWDGFLLPLEIISHLFSFY
jgi:hypothetical protein